MIVCYNKHVRSCSVDSLDCGATDCQFRADGIKKLHFSELEIGPLLDMASFMQESKVLPDCFQNTRSKYVSLIFIACVALANQGDNALGSVKQQKSYFLSKGQWTYGPIYCLSIDTHIRSKRYKVVYF